MRAEPDERSSVKPEWHPELMKGLVSIPQMEPGDTVWWHPDTVMRSRTSMPARLFQRDLHRRLAALREERAYAVKQAKAFLEGRSAPDFAAEDYEVDFRGRASSPT